VRIGSSFFLPWFKEGACVISLDSGISGLPFTAPCAPALPVDWAAREWGIVHCALLDSQFNFAIMAIYPRGVQ